MTLNTLLVRSSEITLMISVVLVSMTFIMTLLSAIASRVPARLKETQEIGSFFDLMWKNEDMLIQKA